MTLRAGVETKAVIRWPVRWACAEPVNSEGSYTFYVPKYAQR